jgi:hypothetical protein
MKRTTMEKLLRGEQVGNENERRIIDMATRTLGQPQLALDDQTRETILNIIFPDGAVEVETQNEAFIRIIVNTITKRHSEFMAGRKPEQPKKGQQHLFEGVEAAEAGSHSQKAAAKRASLPRKPRKKDTPGQSELNFIDPPKGTDPTQD